MSNTAPTLTAASPSERNATSRPRPNSSRDPTPSCQLQRRLRIAAQHSQRRPDRAVAPLDVTTDRALTRDSSSRRTPWVRANRLELALTRRNSEIVKSGYYYRYAIARGRDCRSTVLVGSARRGGRPLDATTLEGGARSHRWPFPGRPINIDGVAGRADRSGILDLAAHAGPLHLRRRIARRRVGNGTRGSHKGHDDHPAERESGRFPQHIVTVGAHRRHGRYRAVHLAASVVIRPP